MSPKKLKSLRPGTKLKLSRSYADFYKKEAFNLCNIGGNITESSASEYFVCMALGYGLPVTITFNRFIENVGDKLPGCHATHKIKDISSSCCLPAKDVSLA